MGGRRRSRREPGTVGNRSLRRDLRPPAGLLSTCGPRGSTAAGSGPIPAARRCPGGCGGPILGALDAPARSVVPRPATPPAGGGQGRGRGPAARGRCRKRPSDCLFRSTTTRRVRAIRWRGRSETAAARPRAQRRPLRRSPDLGLAVGPRRPGAPRRRPTRGPRRGSEPSPRRVGRAARPPSRPAGERSRRRGAGRAPSIGLTRSVDHGHRRLLMIIALTGTQALVSWETIG